MLRAFSASVGRFLFAQFPALANLLSPLNPLIQLYFSFPFARYGPCHPLTSTELSLRNTPSLACG